MPLTPQIVVTPFDKWGMEFIGPIDPPSNEKSYILVCIDYVTKWVEVRAMKNLRDDKVAKLLYEDIFTHYALPKEYVTYQGAQFTSKLITKVMKKYIIRHHKSSPYHPRENGQAKVTNREPEAIMTKIVHIHKKDWTSRLIEAIWAQWTTWKTTTRFTPFEHADGKELIFPIVFEHKTLHTALELNNIFSPVQQERLLLHLNSLDEIQKIALERT